MSFGSVVVGGEWVGRVVVAGIGTEILALPLVPFANQTSSNCEQNPGPGLSEPPGTEEESRGWSRQESVAVRCG